MKLLKNILANNTDKRIVIMPVGLSGSGKTTAYRELSQEFDIEYVSFDKLRKEVYEEKTGKKIEKKEDYRDIYRFFCENRVKLLPKAKEIIANSKKSIIYIDNTNLKKKSRRKFLNTLREHLKICIFFIPDVKKCINNQFSKNRDKFVSPSVILNQYEMLEEPDFDEFDIIIRKRIKNEDCCNNWSIKRTGKGSCQ